jgi:hypothetical protein
MIERLKTSKAVIWASTLASGVFLTITTFIFNNTAMAGKLPVAAARPRQAVPDYENTLTLLLIGVFALIGTKCVLKAIRKKGDGARQN